MTWRTNPVVVAIRSAGRTLGVNKFIASRMPVDAYEFNYDQALKSFIKPNDCVWDVGANVGYYTEAFSEIVGPGGRVFAFEPSAENYARLNQNCSNLPNVVLLQIALGDFNGEAQFQQGADALGATSRITSTPNAGETVKVLDGYTAILNGMARFPNILKIDVEGFEWEVLQGILTLLGESQLRAIGVEMHFGILKQRNIAGAPKLIEQLLSEVGFTLSWPDNSHLLGIRPHQCNT